MSETASTVLLTPSASGGENGTSSAARPLGPVGGAEIQRHQVAAAALVVLPLHQAERQHGSGACENACIPQRPHQTGAFAHGGKQIQARPKLAE